MIDLYRGLVTGLPAWKGFRSTSFVENVAADLSAGTVQNDAQHHRLFSGHRKRIERDNGVLLASASVTLFGNLTETEGTVLIGAENCMLTNGECGFAEGLPAEFATHPLLTARSAIEIFNQITAVWPS